MKGGTGDHILTYKFLKPTSSFKGVPLNPSDNSKVVTLTLYKDKLVMNDTTLTFRSDSTVSIKAPGETDEYIGFEVTDVESSKTGWSIPKMRVRRKDGKNVYTYAFYLRRASALKEYSPTAPEIYAIDTGTPYEPMKTVDTWIREISAIIPSPSDFRLSAKSTPAV